MQDTWKQKGVLRQAQHESRPSFATSFAKASEVKESFGWQSRQEE
jgi:hypothetical protein